MERMPYGCASLNTFPAEPRGSYTTRAMKASQQPHSQGGKGHAVPGTHNEPQGGFGSEDGSKDT